MKQIDYDKYVFQFAANPDHPLEGKQVIIFNPETQEAQHVTILAVSGDRDYTQSGLISDLPITPVFILERMDGESRYIIAEYTGPMYTNEIPEVTLNQMLGLLTRMENILNGQDPAAVSRSFANLITDREDLLPRVWAIRDVLTKDPD